MTVQTHVVTATISPDGLNLPAPILAGTLTMDASWSPFTQASITVPMDIGDLSPYLPGVLPVRIEASVVGDPANALTWNLHARQIRKDHLAGTYTLDLASGEALVQDWGANTSSVAFVSPRAVGGICNDVLEMALGGDISVGADAPFLEIDDELRVWPAGTPAWDYLSNILASLEGRVLFQQPSGNWSIRRNDVTWGSAPVAIPSPEDALSYVEEWSRNGDAADAVTVEYTGGDPTYTMIAVPGSDPAVSVQVEVRRYGRGYLPITETTKPVMAKALDTSTTASRATPQATRDTYATYVRRRRESLHYYLTWRAVSHYGVEPRQAIEAMFVDRITHDFGMNEMTVSARLPYSGDPV